MGMMRHHRPVTTQRREGAVSVQASLMLVNDRFGDMRCVATKALSRLRTDAASAKVGNPRSVLSASYPFMRPRMKGRCPNREGHLQISSYKLYDTPKASISGETCAM